MLSAWGHLKCFSLDFKSKLPCHFTASQLVGIIRTTAKWVFNIITGELECSMVGHIATTIWYPVSWLSCLHIAVDFSGSVPLFNFPQCRHKAGNRGCVWQAAPLLQTLDRQGLETPICPSVTQVYHCKHNGYTIQFLLLKVIQKTMLDLNICAG